MKIRPLGDRILMTRTEKEETTLGGIILPDNTKEKSTFGVVVAVGAGKFLPNGSTREITLKAGDTVLFGKYAGTEITLEGEEYLALREDDIMGVVE